MAAVGIDFVLRAITTGFVKGMATANNSILDLKKNLKAGDVGNGLKQLLGAGAIIQGLRTTINHAQEARKAFEEMGQAVPQHIQNVARLGDSLDDLKKNAIGAATHVVSFITWIGELHGTAFNLWRKVTFGGDTIDSNLGAKIERDADMQQAKRDAALAMREQRNSRENLKKLDEQAANIARKAAFENANAIGKVNLLLKEQTDLMVRLNQLEANPEVVKNDQAKIKEAQNALAAKNAELSAAKSTLTDKNSKLIQSQMDKFLPSIEDLALFQGGTNTGNAGQNAKGAAAQRARDYFNLQMQSRAAYQQGDLAGALSLSQKADQARFGLLGSAKSDEVNKGKELLDTSNRSLTELEQINKAINGIFVVKP